MSCILAHQDVFRAVADPTRRAVLDLLERGDRTAGELVEQFGLSQPAVSKHLRVLREAGLVTSQRDGRQRIYSLCPEPLETLATWIAHYERFWIGKLDALGRYLDRTR